MTFTNWRKMTKIKRIKGKRALTLDSCVKGLDEGFDGGPWLWRCTAFTLTTRCNLGHSNSTPLRTAVWVWETPFLHPWPVKHTNTDAMQSGRFWMVEQMLLLKLNFWIMTKHVWYRVLLPSAYARSLSDSMHSNILCLLVITNILTLRKHQLS